MKNKLVFLVVLFLTFSLSIFQVTGLIFVFPDWSTATPYYDVVGDGASPDEDITNCYVTHDETYLYFKVEYTGTGGCGCRALIIYLDVDQSASTGDTGTEDDYGYDLRDLGVDYRIEIATNHTYGVYKYSAWPWVAPLVSSTQGVGFIELAVELADIGNPTFPVDLLFVSWETANTDYAPNSDNFMYPNRQPVGGAILSVNVFQLLAPYLILTAFIIGSLTVFYKKRVQ